MPDLQVAVVYDLARAGLRVTRACQQVDRAAQVQVADAGGLQEGVVGRLEQPAVVGRHAQERVAAVDHPPQLGQPLPEARHGRCGRLAAVDLHRDAPLERLQAVALAIGGVLAHR